MAGSDWAWCCAGEGGACFPRKHSAWWEVINSQNLPCAIANVDIGQVFTGVCPVSCLQIANAKGILKNFLIEPFVPHKQVSITNKALQRAFKSLVTCMQLRRLDVLAKAVWECAVKLTASVCEVRAVLRLSVSPWLLLLC